MKCIAICVLLLVAFSSTAQPDTAYQSLIARAGLFHLQKNYKAAIALYEKAFALHQPDALHAYKAAGVYALDSNAGKSVAYLNLALSRGWIEADWLALDPYFNYLRDSDSLQWTQITAAAFAAEKSYEKKLKLPLVRKQINRMMLTDQQLRYRQAQKQPTKQQREEVSRLIYQAGIDNKAAAQKIIAQYGWPSVKDIGNDGQNNLWLIVQHADDDVLFQQKVLNAMKKHLGTNRLNAENYAFLYDRVQCNLNYKQYYGTQVQWTHHGEASGFRPILSEEKADVRRMQLGMQPLAVYALTYGFSYLPVTAAQARQNERHDSLQTQLLIDSAAACYMRKNYTGLYDFYNTASAIAGGMDQQDNYEAAVVFCRVAEVTREQRYKDIALDFINLLYVRQQLTRNALLQQPAFRVLHNETRWKNIANQVQ